MKKRQYARKPAPDTSVLSAGNLLQTRPFQADSINQQTPQVQKESEALTGGFDLTKQYLLNPPTTVSGQPLQAKLTIGQPNDKYEQEADRVAQHVVQQLHSPQMEYPQEQQSVQREFMPAEDELQMKPLADQIQRAELPEDEELQMKPDELQRESMPEEDDELQMKPMVQMQGGGTVAANAEFESAIQQSRGSGQPLTDTLRQPLERAFGGVDFSGVKVHTDARSDQLNHSIQAKAFTTGQDVFFRQGAYDPSSRGGQELIAHELTHVVQQNGGVVQRLVQREEYLDQRDVSSHYTGSNDETTVQRPGLLGAIGSVVTQLQDAHKAYIELQKKMGTGQATLQQVNEKFKLRAKLYEFLRLQDVNVDLKGNLAPDALTGRLVEYDTSPEAQQKTLVNISGGTLKRSDSKNTPVDTSDSVTFQTGKGWEIFVMSPSGELHMASHKIGKYHHSSLLAGGPTAAAGSIKASGGKIQELNNKSGHYQPGPQQMRQALHRFHTAGVSLDFDLKILGAFPFTGKASAFMDQGGLDAFEFESAQRILHHFINIKGVAAVSKAFTDLGWDYKLQTGRIFIFKPNGDPATHKEVRSILTTHFNSSGPVSITRD